VDVLDRIDPRLCVACKASRGLCGIDPCPLLQRIQHTMPRVVREGRHIGPDIFGSSPPSLFVGRHGYPKVSIGPMLPPEHLEEADARNLDSPRDWLALGIPDIVGLRSSLVRTTHSVKVDMAWQPDRITRLAQELALAARPVDTEVHLSRAPRFGIPTVGEFTAPHGPTVEVERAQLAENVRVEAPVERAFADTDLRAGEAVVGLHRGGTDIYHLERLMSAGVLGLGQKRRLVPTRWGITATDDQVGKALIEEVRGHPTLDKPVVHFAERFGNRFHVLLLPRVWGFGNVEAWGRGSFWAQAGTGTGIVAAQDWEDHDGRTTYAANTAGGYYATRLSVLEHLARIRRQATAIVLREITDDYTTPLGVWVVRETARLALESKPLLFEDVESALRHIDRRALHKAWQRDATFLAAVRRQRSLDSYASV
jgi:DNA repair protein NreA